MSSLSSLFSLGQSEDTRPTVAMCAVDGSTMPRAVCLGKWTVLSPQVLTHPVKGSLGITFMTQFAISVRCSMAVRG